MTEKYLTEAFQELSILDEDVFDITDDGIAKAQEFVSSDNEMDFEEIIDPLAETEEDLQDSYIGKVILDCSICQSKIYKDAEEVTMNEEETLVNVGEVCPYCQSSDGYKVIGQVAPFAKAEEPEVKTDDENAEVAVDEIDAEESEEDLDEAIASKKGKKKLDAMKEDLNNVQIETDNERITVTSEPKEPAMGEGEMVAPIEPETEEQFGSEEDEFQDIEIDEFDEANFDELGESYLRKIYENVKGYKTSKASTKGNTLKLEGVITFKSGKTAKTNFVFESSSVTKKGLVKFTGLNEQFAKGRKTFTLTGKVNEGKLIAESLTYNYRSKDAEGKSKRIYGRVVKR